MAGLDKKISEMTEVFSASGSELIPLAVPNIDNLHISVDNLLSGKADVVHSHTAADVGLGNVANLSPANLPLSTASVSALALKADLVGGVVPLVQIPAIAIMDYLGTVADEPTMLGLVGEKGDFAIRSDTVTTWIIVGNDPSMLSNWVELPILSGGGIPDYIHQQ